MKKTLCAATLSLLFFQPYALAEVVLGFGISPGTGLCTDYSDDELQSMYDNFTEKTLTLFRENNALDYIFRQANSIQLSKNIEESAAHIPLIRNNCRIYLNTRQYLLEHAITENQQNQNTAGYIPWDVAGYFIQMEKSFYPAHDKKQLKKIINEVLAKHPKMRSYFLKELVGN